MNPVETGTDLLFYYLIILQQVLNFSATIYEQKKRTLPQLVLISGDASR